MGPAEEQEDKRRQLEEELQLVNDYLAKHVGRAEHGELGVWR